MTTMTTEAPPVTLPGKRKPDAPRLPVVFPMTTPDLLRAAADLIAPMERWARGSLARTADGADCKPHAQEAHAWCVAGAVYRFEGARPELARAAMRFLNRAAAIAFGLGVSVPHLNDSAYVGTAEQAHATVVGLLLVAACLAEQEERAAA